jgi:hypothetical protein
MIDINEIEDDFLSHLSYHEVPLTHNADQFAQFLRDFHINV